MYIMETCLDFKLFVCTKIHVSIQSTSHGPWICVCLHRVCSRSPMCGTHTYMNGVLVGVGLVCPVQCPILHTGTAPGHSTSSLAKAVQLAEWQTWELCVFLPRASLVFCLFVLSFFFSSLVY